MTQTDILRHAVLLLERLAIPYAIVGSYGGLVYGEPRTTQDIDIVMLLPTEKISEFCAGFPSPEYYISEQAVRDAVLTRFQFNVLHTTSGVKLDFIFPPAGEWGLGQISRRKQVYLRPDLPVYVASPEDIILGKLWYHSIGHSDKHLRDITGILRTSCDRVDRAFISEWAAKLDFTETWERILARLA